jgi:hypothetical protein
MRINEIVNESRSSKYDTLRSKEEFSIARSNLDARELNLLKQYKEELLNKLEQRGISPDIVGKGVTLDPPESWSLQQKLELYRSQTKAMKEKLQSDTRSFVQPGTQFQQQKKMMKQRSGPVKTMTGAEYMAQHELGKP